MKKILLVLNAGDAPQHVIDSAIAIAGADNALLYALFLEPAVYQPTMGYPFNMEPSFAGQVMYPGAVLPEEQQETNATIQAFINACTAAGIAYKISPARETALDELIHHSAFADLIIADAQSDFPPTLPLMISLSDILTDAHCPVLLLQQTIQRPARVILSYDGSFSSIHALKMFSYTFPEWRNIPTCLLSVFSKAGAQLEYEEYIKDWLPQHFPDLKVDLLKGDPKKQLLESIASSGPDTLVVMGSYGRTAVSRLFHKSLSNGIINDTKAAIFIAHER